MTDTQRKAFEAKFPAPVGVTLFGKEYVWFGGNDHGRTCDFYNDMWKAFQAGLEANTMQLQAIYDDMYRHKDIAQVAQKLFILINGQAALAHSQQWISVDDRLPDVPKGQYQFFNVAIVRHHDKKTYVVPAVYLNQMELTNAHSYDDEIFTGWHEAKEHYEFDEYYSKLETAGDKVTHWMSLPQPPITNRKD